MGGIQTQSVALGVLEIDSIARGLKVHDELVKRAAAHVLRAHPISPGRYLLIIGGEVAEVEESMTAAKLEADIFLHQWLLLPHIDEQVLHAISGTIVRTPMDTLGILESQSISPMIGASDVAVKQTGVTILQLRLASSIGGKAVLLIGGDVDTVEAALEVGENRIDDGFLAKEIIRNPHEDFVAQLL